MNERLPRVSAVLAAMVKHRHSVHPLLYAQPIMPVAHRKSSPTPSSTTTRLVNVETRPGRNLGGSLLDDTVRANLVRNLCTGQDTGAALQAGKGSRRRRPDRRRVADLLARLGQLLGEPSRLDDAGLPVSRGAAAVRWPMWRFPPGIFGTGLFNGSAADPTAHYRVDCSFIRAIRACWSAVMSETVTLCIDAASRMPRFSIASQLS